MIFLFTFAKVQIIFHLKAKKMHKAGFINIIGFSNVGKSTLLNALIGEKLVIVTPKVQTTRHRILGIYNDEDTQIVFSDTPGYIETPFYALHKKMNDTVLNVFEDADALMFITEPDVKDFGVLGDTIKKQNKPLFIFVNKADLSSVDKLQSYSEWLVSEFNSQHVYIISALHKFNTDRIIPLLKTILPKHPPYFPKDDISDRNLRFFIAEMIREQLFLLYKKEIPYSSEVLIEQYKEIENLTVIKAYLLVERESQKMILLGKNGSAIKQLGIKSRKMIEDYIGAKVHLELTVRVVKNWRNNAEILKKLGYQK